MVNVFIIKCQIFYEEFSNKSIGPSKYAIDCLPLNFIIAVYSVIFGLSEATFKIIRYAFNELFLVKRFKKRLLIVSIYLEILKLKFLRLIRVWVSFRKLLIDFRHSNKVFIIIVIYQYFFLVIYLQEIYILVFYNANVLGNCIEGEIYFNC